MDRKEEKRPTANDVEAVITSYNQGSMILEAVCSLCGQTTLPARIIIVDDGSTDENSIQILYRLESDSDIPVPVTVLHQSNSGVSTARNTGIRMAQAPMVLVLDGDDKLENTYVEQVSRLLRNDSSMTAASSWLHTFGVLDSVVCPCGGNITEFLAKNCCPATHILKREVWEKCGGYDESMRSGFEDWDFFLSMLEAVPDTKIGIVEEALIHYRTAPASSNVRSMTKRLELMNYIIKKHINSYQKHIAEAILGIESISMSRLYGWENEMIHAMELGQGMGEASSDFMKHPTYGDGGMAAAVRIKSIS